MRLQLWASHTERRVELHRSHRGIWSEDYLNIVVEVHGEIDLTGTAMRPAMHIAQIGMTFCCAATGWTKQIPRHIENARSRGTQAHLQHGASIDFPMVGECIRPNPLDGQLIRLIQKIFKTGHQRCISPLLNHGLTQRLETGPAFRAESPRPRECNDRATFVRETIVDTQGSLEPVFRDDANHKWESKPRQEVAGLHPGLITDGCASLSARIQIDLHAHFSDWTFAIRS